MSLRTSATRYARALLDVAIQESDPGRIERDLSQMVETMTQHEELRRVLASPSVPQAARVDLVRALADRSGLDKPLAKLLVMLAERGRLELLPVVLDVYRERLLAHSHIVRAAVTSAQPLAPEKIESLAESLRGLTGKTVQLATGVDPSLIGGVVTRIGSTVYDGSVRTQLQKMRQQLVDNG